tara:strand:- start:6257 stop:6649 length:393 start_codon:yes stop_codon:yes gene_type:complete
MTCFWDGILRSLKKEDFDYVSYNEPKTQLNFINFLKKNKREMNNVLWQNNTLREQEITECLSWIGEYDIKGIHDGHLTSVCDPFLLLICELFSVNITHNYGKHTILYVNKCKVRKTLLFSSNGSHFVCSR